MKIFILFLFSITSVYAEYLFFEESAEGVLSPLKGSYLYREVDRLKMIYQYPMSTNESNKAYIDSLTPEESHLRDTNETQFLETMINKQIHHRFPNRFIRVFYIPTTLYELYTIQARPSGLKLSKSNDFYSQISTNNFESDADRLSSQRQSDSHFMESFKIQSEGLWMQRFILNHEITSSIFQLAAPQFKNTPYFKKSPMWYLLEVLILDWKKTLPLSGSKRQKPIDWTSLLISYAEQPLSKKFNNEENLILFLKTVIKDEAILFALGKIPFYRGHKDLMENLKDHNGKWSLSYGSSLFAGFNIEERRSQSGACAWTYFMQEDYYGQRLEVTQKGIRDGHVSLFVPPLDTVSAMLASGEFFHPRTLLAKGIRRGEYCKGLYCSTTSKVVQRYIVSKKTIDELADEWNGHNKIYIKMKDSPIIPIENACHLKKKKSEQEMQIELNIQKYLNFIK
jgi:hypothetical protein